MQQKLVVGDRVRYDDNFGTVKEVMPGGYRVRWNNGEEIEEMAGDLIRANPDDMCEAAEALEVWPYSRPCKNNREEDSQFCDEHRHLESQARH